GGRYYDSFFDPSAWTFRHGWSGRNEFHLLMTTTSTGTRTPFSMVGATSLPALVTFWNGGSGNLDVLIRHAGATFSPAAAAGVTLNAAQCWELSFVDDSSGAEIRRLINGTVNASDDSSQAPLSTDQATLRMGYSTAGFGVGFA